MYAHLEKSATSKIAFEPFSHCPKNAKTHSHTFLPLFSLDKRVFSTWFLALILQHNADAHSIRHSLSLCSLLALNVHKLQCKNAYFFENKNFSHLMPPTPTHSLGVATINASLHYDFKVHKKESIRESRKANTSTVFSSFHQTFFDQLSSGLFSMLLFFLLSSSYCILHFCIAYINIHGEFATTTTSESREMRRKWMRKLQKIVQI